MGYMQRQKKTDRRQTLIHSQTQQDGSYVQSWTLKQVSSLRAIMHYGRSKHGQDSVVVCQQGEHPFNKTVTFSKK